jgi:hypothetical protein
MMATQLTERDAHRQAGLVAAFMWQDEASEGHLDAKEVGVDYTTVLGTLPEEVNGSPVFLVHVQGTATSVFDYSYPVERTLKIFMQDAEHEEDRQPMTEIATDEEIEACEQHNRAKACKEYAELSHIVAVDAYIEGDNGEYWYPDSENGIDVSARLLELEGNALEQGLHFIPVKEGEKTTGYQLEPASAEEIATYQKAKEEAEEAEMEAEAEREAQQRQAERLAFLEKRVRELADEIALHNIVERHQSSLQVVILETEPHPEQPSGWTPPRPDKFLPEHTRNLIDKYPGMLFHAGQLVGWLVGLTVDKQKIVFVPTSLYDPYEQECLQAVGCTPEQTQEWYESIETEDEETGEVETPDWPNPLERKGKWKARQVAHWTGEEETTPEIDHSVWANGTWG